MAIHPNVVGIFQSGPKRWSDQLTKAQLLLHWHPQSLRIQAAATVPNNMEYRDKLNEHLNKWGETLEMQMLQTGFSLHSHQISTSRVC